MNLLIIDVLERPMFDDVYMFVTGMFYHVFSSHCLKIVRGQGISEQS